MHNLILKIDATASAESYQAWMTAFVALGIPTGYFAAASLNSVLGGSPSVALIVLTAILFLLAAAAFAQSDVAEGRRAMQSELIESPEMQV